MSRRTALSSPMALLLLFLAAVVSTRAQTAAAAAVAVAEGAPVLLECAVAVAAAAAWSRDGGPLPRALRPAGERAAPDGTVLARLAAPRAAPALAGEYRCGPAPHQRTRLVVLPAPLSGTPPPPSSRPAPLRPRLFPAQTRGRGSRRPRFDETSLNL
ncbi:unnamed protein product [Plutella xylostella]|uniref:(diamondback moth) hypothetical protein n=1 Tax=Plutella xylostella TaxID=51655 RepID=A0A8S4FJY6_PLUXY|nr:unnamed protein product [Plutella xylostella]